MSRKLRTAENPRQSESPKAKNQQKPSHDFTKWIVRSLAFGQLNKKLSKDAENWIDDWEVLAMVKDYLFW